ncbi:hypothetical protein J2X68_007581 [Streptomyces sp. 3330]|nr:hypothetical protein [Streptomyces sp. 3330]
MPEQPSPTAYPCEACQPARYAPTAHPSSAAPSISGTPISTSSQTPQPGSPASQAWTASPTPTWRQHPSATAWPGSPPPP